METPICDFVRKYAGSGTIRAHMPGHKGKETLFAEEPSGAHPTSGGRFGEETGEGSREDTKETYNSAFAKIAKYDITEIARADDLYDPHGIIAESEANASRVFGCPTFYSTEGSSLCIRAMLYICMMKQNEEAAKKAAGTRRGAGAGSAHESWMAAGKKSRAGTEAARVPWVLAGRDAHKTFLSACILLGLDVEWVAPEAGDEVIDDVDVKNALLAGIKAHGFPPCCVYVTTPTYIGWNVSIREVAKICHYYGVYVVVDNAHGAYLHFYPYYHFGSDRKSTLDPISQGADMCCDSAHKTLPVLTGGAYLHLRKGFYPGELDPKRKAEPGRMVKEAMSLFASTSPSWLILQSLDKQNPYLAGAFGKEVERMDEAVYEARSALKDAGFELIGNDRLRITIATRGWGYTGDEFAEILRTPVVIDVAPDEVAVVPGEVDETPDKGENEKRKKAPAEHVVRAVEVEFSDPDVVVMMFTPSNTSTELAEIVDRILRIPKRAPLPPSPELGSELPEKVMTMREAALLPGEFVSVGEALGRVAQLMDVSCPPAIPIVMPGERIGENEIARLRYYGYEMCMVVRE